MCALRGEEKGCTGPGRVNDFLGKINGPLEDQTR